MVWGVGRRGGNVPTPDVNGRLIAKVDAVSKNGLWPRLKTANLLNRQEKHPVDHAVHSEPAHVTGFGSLGCSSCFGLVEDGHTSIYLSIYLSIYIYTHIHTYIHTYIHTCICMCIYIYIYIYIHLLSPAPQPMWRKSIDCSRARTASSAKPQTLPNKKRE